LIFLVRNSINISLLTERKQTLRAHHAAKTGTKLISKMKIDWKVKRFCSHCNHDSVQEYLAHHPYDAKQRDLWDGDPQTAKEPAAYFVFGCRSCGEVLVYHYEAEDEFDFEELFPFTQGGVEKMGWDQDEINSGLELMWPSRPKSPKLPQYRQEICPYCPRSARQRLLYGTNDFPEPYVEGGTVVLQTLTETTSLFRCEQCNATLLYKTTCDDLDGPEIVSDKKPNWIIDLDYNEFEKNSILLYAHPSSNQSVLAPSTPASVKKCYETAQRVRSISTDLYALQLRKTLEAVCKDLGAADSTG
jgi:hypothetical protein